jgi:HAD superfamily hydrolase (TIGR01509 family)
MHLPGVRAEITTALLDIDGTLLDSNDAHAHAWVEALGEHGFTTPYAHVRSLVGMGADQLLPAIAAYLSPDAEPGASIVRRRGEIFKARYVDGLQPTPGARELLLALIADGITCVAATSAKEDELDLLLERAGVADLISTKSTADDVRVSKPAPDIVHAALQRSHAIATRSLMLGDTKYDVTAARRAGVATIALRCGGSSDFDLAGAEAIYDDPLSLVAAMRIS